MGMTSCRYLGVLLISGQRFKCRFDDAIAKFHRTCKAIMGKGGRIAVQEETFTLVKSKCVPTLLYCLEVCPLNTKDTKSLEYPITCALFRIVQPNSYGTIEECERSFGVKLLSDIATARKSTFLQCYSGFSNITYSVNCCVHFIN